MTFIDSDHDHRPEADRLALDELGSVSFGSRVAWLMSSPWRVALLAVAAVLAVDAGGTDDAPGVCVFRRCTGGYCPGCGLTRSARHLTRGEIGAAWSDHPIIVLVAAQAAAAALLYASTARLRAGLRSVRTLAVVGAANGLLLLAIWIVRLVDGSIPRFF